MLYFRQKGSGAIRSCQLTPEYFDPVSSSFRSRRQDHFSIHISSPGDKSCPFLLPSAASLPLPSPLCASTSHTTHPSCPDIRSVAVPYAALPPSQPQFPAAAAYAALSSPHRLHMQARQGPHPLSLVRSVLLIGTYPEAAWKSP